MKIIVILFFSFLTVFCNGKESDWMDLHVKKELEVFPEITKEQLDGAQQFLSEKRISFIRIQIQQGVASCKSFHTEAKAHYNRMCFLLSHLENLLSLFHLKDLDFILALDDGLPDYTAIRCPIFCVSKQKQQKNIIVLPLLSLSERECQVREDIDKEGEQTLWEDKKEVAFWRGSTTGIVYSKDNFREALRTKLILFAKEFPQVLDCAFSYSSQSTPEVDEIMHELGLFEPFMNPISQLKMYKYLIAIDGNTWASSLKWQLFSGSVVLKNESDWVEWYDSELIPFENYVPYKSDMSDLYEQIEWLKVHDEEARNIASKARVFAKQNLTYNQIGLYIQKLLNEYSSRLYNDCDSKIDRSITM